MADQLAAPALAVYGHNVVRTPHLDALARRGVVFENAYCNYPQCAPSRFSMLSGQLPSQIGAYDNAAEFPASVPTFVHYLRLSGYQTCLSGKMHFVGPDQQHGFEERLTTEIYPSDFTWCPDWTRKEPSYNWSHRLKIITESGVCARSLQLDYDEEVAFHAERKIYDYARQKERRPFFLAASFTHPHNPYVITREYWDRYAHDEIDAPAVSRIPLEQCDPHSRRLYEQFGLESGEITEDDVRKTRHAYYAMISYIDDKVGQLLGALREAGLADDTVVIFTADHGDMMGERGLFYKMNFFEWSARIPLIISTPNGVPSRRCEKNVSLVDLFPTVLELARVSRTDLVEAVDGQSLGGLMRGDEAGWRDRVYAEYLAEGAIAPCLMIRRGRYKLIYSEPDPPQLYDLVQDPRELINLAGRQDHADKLGTLLQELHEVWDSQSLKELIIESQAQRRRVDEALHKGEYVPWDFQPFINAAGQYIRSGQAVADAEPRSRLPASESRHETR